jgi:hypothetical protein
VVVSGGGVVEVVVSAADSVADSVVVVAKDVSPAIVVRDLGTCVHLFPFIDVIVNPSGRFAFVDMVQKKKRHPSL